MIDASAPAARFKHRDAIYCGIILAAAPITLSLVNGLRRAG